MQLVPICNYLLVACDTLINYYVFVKFNVTSDPKNLIYTLVAFFQFPLYSNPASRVQDQGPMLIQLNTNLPISKE